MGACSHLGVCTIRGAQEFAAAADSAVRLLVSDPNRLCGVFSLAGHHPQSGDGVIAEVALPRWRYVAGHGLHGRPSVRYRTYRLGAPDAVPRAARAGAPSKDACDGPLARRGQLTRSPGGLAGGLLLGLSNL
jgi:hypothetical protein